jgi:hypothetical protein
MKVNELIGIALDNFDNITVDEAMRHIKTVLRELNSVFSGLYKTISVEPSEEDDSLIELSGNEKYIYAVLIGGNEAVKVRNVKDLSRHKYSFTRPSFDKLIVSYPEGNDKPVIEIRGLFAFDTDIDRDSDIPIPPSYDGLLVNGMLYYFYRQPRYAELKGAEALAEPYYRALNGFANRMNEALPPIDDKGSWDYYELKRI